MKLVEIAANAQVPVSTCSDIINKAKRKALETGNPDLCCAENLAPEPNSTKGCNSVLTAMEKQRLIELALSDTEHCRMTFEELGAAGWFMKGCLSLKSQPIQSESQCVRKYY